jgi:hypothetical protein
MALFRRHGSVTSGIDDMSGASSAVPRELISQRSRKFKVLSKLFDKVVTCCFEPELGFQPRKFIGDLEILICVRRNVIKGGKGHQAKRSCQGV